MSETWCCIGGTGTFGREAVRQLLADPGVRKIRVMSRDEKKQAELKAEFPEASRENRLITMLGDVRDLERVDRACEGATHVLHAAALKRVEACQADVEECIRTNVLGTLNVAKAVVRQGVEGAVLISSDKAADPVNAYGTSKAMAEHAWLSTSRAWGSRSTRLVAVRYGNVWGSRGSVVEDWKARVAAGQPIHLRDPGATRFFFPICEGVRLAIWAGRSGEAGWLYAPMLKAATLGELASAFGAEIKIGALLDAEKKHETLLTSHEASRCRDQGEPSIGLTFHAVAPITGTRPQSGRVGCGPVRSDEAPRLLPSQLRRAISGEDVWTL